MTEKKWTALSFAAMAAAILCELLPYGAVLRFMGNPETGEINRHTYSYFSLTPLRLCQFRPADHRCFKHGAGNYAVGPAVCQKAADSAADRRAGDWLCGVGSISDAAADAWSGILFLAGRGDHGTAFAGSHIRVYCEKMLDKPDDAK